VRIRIAFTLLLVLFVVACGGSGQDTPTVPTAPLPPPPGTPPSPTPQAPLVILVLPADTPPDQSDLYQTLTYDLAQAHGMRFQVRNTLAIADVEMESPALKIVVAMPPDPGLVALAAAAPGVQFLAVGIPDLIAAGNLTTIAAEGRPVGQQAFLAGYIAALLSSEWRVGILTEKDTAAGQLAEASFINGYHFYCGLCTNPNFSQPRYNYPIHIEIPLDVPAGQYPAYSDVLLDYYVNVAYVYPGLATPELLHYMASNRLVLIGESLLIEDIRPNWAVSIEPDILLAVEQIFPDLVAGLGGQNIPTPLFLTDINPNLLTDGKLRLVEQVLADLQAGYIDPGVSP